MCKKRVGQFVRVLNLNSISINKVVAIGFKTLIVSQSLNQILEMPTVRNQLSRKRI